jgi:hypothetical protein
MDCQSHVGPLTATHAALYKKRCLEDVNNIQKETNQSIKKAQTTLEDGSPCALTHALSTLPFFF